MMTEEEYLLVTNRMRITLALESLRGVVCLPRPGDDARLADAARTLSEIEQHLFGKTKTKAS